ncbi:MAG TPA: DUF2155 domain-containing protein [Methylovirgula sp.]|nr:DUF2155 domain-containing protein [Methylovirgula sp.]
MRRNQTRCLIFLVGFAGLFAASVLTIDAAAADKIKHSIAVFSGLDKITGRIISFEVATDETVQFGSLQITERVCYTRPPTEAPQTDTFVEVDEVDADNQTKRIFTGWMFAASPGLHALDHPVYDIWLTDCKGDQQVIASPPAAAEAETPPVEAAKPPEPPQPQRPVNTQGQGQPSGPIEVGPPPGFLPPGAQPPTTQESIPTTPPPDGTGGF